ncbi:MAG: ExeM/NucH family extracellular endonuclease [Anaerolineales bacterium]|nr:ExeM/NucH family extracellular endonuclease [Anaerolineales bacterium]
MIRKTAYLGLLLLLSFLALAAVTLLKPSAVVAAPPYYARGDFNSWNPTDQMFDDGTHGDVTAADGIYTTVITPTTAGRYEWKAANADWSEAWPSSNAWLVTSIDNQPVVVTLDTNAQNDGWSPNQYIVNAADGITTWTAVGDWQGWDNGNAATAMSLVSGGVYRFYTTIATPGVHQYKAVKTGSWDAVGQDGSGGGRSINTSNWDFTTTVADEKVVFWLDSTTGRILVQPLGSIVINELDADQVGTDGAEFIEFYDGGVGNMPLDGLVIVFYNGSNDLSYFSQDLDSYATNADGYFVMCGNAANVPNCDLDVNPNTDLIQNGQDAVALYMGDASSFPTNTPVTTLNLLDALVYDTSDPDDPGLLVLLNPGQPQVDENGGGSGTTQSNQRCPNGSGGQRNTDTYTQQLPTPGSMNCAPSLAISKVAPALTSIGDVFEYTIWVTNTGLSAATGLVVTDTLPVGVAYAYGGSYTGGVVSFTGVDPLAVNTPISFTFGVTVTASFGDVITNDDYAARVNELSGVTSGAPVLTSVSALDLVVSKTGAAVAIAGEETAYTIQVNNVGVAPALGVVVTDTIPVSTTLFTQNSNALTFTAYNNLLVWEFGDVPSNTLETIVLTITVDANVASNTILTNTVIATTLTSGDPLINNSDSWTSTVYQLVPIATARAGVNGDVFAVQGQVIYVPGTYNTTSWGLQDATGGITAFYSPAPSVALNDVVRLMATRGSFSNEEEFIAPVYYFANLGQGTPVVPAVYTTNGVATGDSEGWLAQIEGTISGLSACSSNYSFNVDDGSGPATVYIDQDTGVNICAQGAQNGDTVRVTGYSVQFNSLFELKPRQPSDILLFQDVPALSKTAPAQVLPGELFTYTLTLQNFTGMTLTNVVITDTVPANASFVSALNGGTYANNIVTWNVGDLTDQNTLSVQFAVTATLSSPVIIANDDYAVVASNYPTPTFGASVSTLVVDVIGPNCGDPAVPIHGIQGSGSTSPLVGYEVTIEGVVVGDYQIDLSGFKGFFVQEEDAEVDANPMTSEGIFVYDNTFGVDVQAGDVVRVAGIVAESFGLTELKTLTSVLVCSSGASVTPTTITLPVSSLNDWEAYEGMLVTVADPLNPLYVTEIYDLGHYGEVSLSVNDRLDQPTQVTDPGASALALQDLNDRSRILLDDGLTASYPDPIIYPSPELSATNTLRGGDMLDNLTGVLNYGFGSYLIEPTGPITFTHSNPRPTEPEPISGTLKVVSFNVLNYFSTIDDGVNDICGPLGNMECRGADSAEEFTRQRDKTINALLSIDADVVGLLEIENNADDEAVDDLINGLNAIAGAGTYAKINTGPIGGDAIKVAIIYKPASVTPIGTTSVLDTEAFINGGDSGPRNRASVLQAFEENATGEVFLVNINHLKSKGSACDDPDAGDGQGNCNIVRVNAVAELFAWFATDPTGTGDPDILLLGDLNSYAMEDPIAALEAGGFTNLHTLNGPDYYSYVFFGQWGTLDYGLANTSMLSQVSGVTVWHINADEPVALDYNMENWSPDQLISLYSPEPFRTSDHDPIIIGLNLVTPPLEADFTSNSPVMLGDLSVFTSTVSETGVAYNWAFGDGNTSTDANPTHTYDAIGTYTVTLQVTNGTLTVTVTHPYVVVETPVEEHILYLPLVYQSFTSAAPAQTQAKLPISGIVFAFVGMGGILTFRRKK